MPSSELLCSWPSWPLAGQFALRRRIDAESGWIPRLTSVLGGDQRAVTVDEPPLVRLVADAVIEAFTGGGRDLGVGVAVAVAVLVAVAVAVAVGFGVFVAVGFGVFVAVGFGVFVAVGFGVFVAVGTGVGVAVGTGHSQSPVPGLKSQFGLGRGGRGVGVAVGVAGSSGSQSRSNGLQCVCRDGPDWPLAVTKTAKEAVRTRIPME